MGTKYKREKGHMIKYIIHDEDLKIMDMYKNHIFLNKNYRNYKAIEAYQ